MTVPDYSPEREIHRWRRARRFAAEARRQISDDGKAFYRRKAIREHDAARVAHRLIMRWRSGTSEDNQFKEVA